MGCILCSVSGRGVYFAVSHVEKVVLICILCSFSGRERGVYYTVSQVGNGVYTMQCVMCSMSGIGKGVYTVL